MIKQCPVCGRYMIRDGRRNYCSAYCTRIAKRAETKASHTGVDIDNVVLVYKRMELNDWCVSYERYRTIRSDLQMRREDYQTDAEREYQAKLKALYDSNTDSIAVLPEEPDKLYEEDVPEDFRAVKRSGVKRKKREFDSTMPSSVKGWSLEDVAAKAYACGYGGNYGEFVADVERGVRRYEGR